MRRIKKSIVIALAAAGVVFAQNTQQWQNLYPTYNGLAFGNGKFVAVSGDGLIRTSSDGEAWSQYFVRGDGANSRSVYAVAYGGGEFVATQNNASFLRSADGAGWYSEGMGSNIPVRYLTFGNDNFVGVGDDGFAFLYDKEDGWINRETSANNLSHAAAGAGGYIVVGDGVFWSQDALGWKTASGASVSGGVGVVAFGGDKFVALAKNGGSVLTTDNVKNSWTKTDATAVPAGMADMVFGGGKFVAVGKAGRACVSSDGSSWRASNGLNPDDDFTAVKYGGNTYLALGAKGSVYKSSDGSTWTKLAGKSVTSYKQIAYSGSKFVAVGDSGVSVSSDGKSWERKGDAKGLNGVAFGGGKFVAVGDGGVIIYSADGDTWTPGEGVDNSSILTSVAFGGGKFVVGGKTSGNFAVITVSTDGQHWNSQDVEIAWGVGKFPVSLCFGKDKFLAAVMGTKSMKTCEAAGALQYWDDVGLPNEADEYSIVSTVYANEKFVATGTKRTGEAIVLNSADGDSWQAISVPSNIKGLKSATYAKGTNIAVGDSGNIYAVFGGEWKLQGKATNRDLSAIFSVPGKAIVLAAGAKGAMLYTEAEPTSVKHAAAPRAAASSKTGLMRVNRFGRTPVVTLSFTPNSAGAIAVYSLSGRQLYKTRLVAGERNVSLPERAISNGSVIVRYSGGGRVVNQRFQFVR